MATYLNDREKCEAVARICNLYATGRFTLRDCCKRYNVSSTAFSMWTAPRINVLELLAKGLPIPEGCIPNCNEMYLKAKRVNQENYEFNLREKARHGLEKKVSGYDYEETVKEYAIDSREFIIDKITGEEIENPNYGHKYLVKEKVANKQREPDTTSIIFALTNVDGDTFKNRQTIDANLDVSVTGFENMPDSDLEAKIKDLEAKIR
jgi:hypothetical protein